MCIILHVSRLVPSGVISTSRTCSDIIHIETRATPHVSSTHIPNSPSSSIMSGIPGLPDKFDDLPDKRRFWPSPAGSADEGLGMLRLLTPELVANAARTQIQTGERVCLNWDIENLTPPGT